MPAEAIESFRVASVGTDVAIMAVVFVVFLIPAVVLFSKQD
jgi:ABC-type transport system involved in multi-copper enzyme maturation permease subunit